jgi:acetyltransferase-like isoleucine patch superfamily enzyme
MTYLEHDWFPRPVPDYVEIEGGAWLYSSYAFHHNRGRVRIGAHTGIYSGTAFELGPCGEAVIGAFCTIVGPVIASNGPVYIGDHSFVAHEVFIAGHAFARPPGERTDGPEDAPIEIGSGAWIGARAVVLGGSRIGRDAIVGAGAVVRGDVPAGATAVGNPVRIHGG